MADSKALRTRRSEILEEIDRLELVRRGSVVEQFVETVRADGSTGRRGPYRLYSFKDQGETISRRLHSAEEANQYRQQIEAFRQLQKLVAELVAIGEQLSDLVLSGEEAPEKKRRKSPSSGHHAFPRRIR